MLVEVEKANAGAIDAKKAKKAEEKTLELQIAEYNKKKALKEEGERHEAVRMRDEKEKEI